MLVRICWSFLFVSFILFPNWTVRAQLISSPEMQCATQILSPTDRKQLEAEAALALRLKQASGSAFNSLTYVPIRPHIIRRSNGTGGYSLASLNNVMALTNKYYLQNGSGIQFYFAGISPDYIDNDALYNQFRQYTDEASLTGRDATNALNQYYVQAFNSSSLGGYAYFPANNVTYTRSFISVLSSNSDLGNRLVPHELGHTFNLLHTFESAYGYERVTRDPGAGANCTTAGDLVCDTPADPYGRFSGASSSCVSGCPSTFNCTFVDDQGNLFTPSPTNIMSYYYPCDHDFTAGQYDRIQAGLALRQSHTAYTLDAPATAMTAPSNVVASIQNYQVVITWQDNASNEMGYFIERSTSPTTGFAPIGGVAPNGTTFTDASTTARVRYYYRVKASNTTTGSISPTVTAVAPECRPSFQYDGCSYDITLTGVVVNGTTLSENSGCSPSTTGYYTSFTAISGTVTAGQSATFIAQKGTTTYNVSGTIWIDLNNNGAFEPSEQLYQSPLNSDGTFSGSLTIPASVTASTVAMRVMVASGFLPNDACATMFTSGETEDYILVVIPACTTPITTLKNGNWDDPTVWSCNRVPTSTDLVQVGHSVVVPDNFTAQALRVVYASNGLLTFGVTAQLQLSSTP